jgi:hypothetical protein
MFQPSPKQLTEGQAKKGTLSDLKDQQWQKPVASKNQDWVSWLLQQLSILWIIKRHGLTSFSAP